MRRKKITEFNRNNPQTSWWTAKMRKIYINESTPYNLQQFWMNTPYQILLCKQCEWCSNQLVEGFFIFRKFCVCFCTSIKCYEISTVNLELFELLTTIYSIYLLNICMFFFVVVVFPFKWSAYISQSVEQFNVVFILNQSTI